jgi:alpha-beta hydrolase superfamily lysophospholipase
MATTFQRSSWRAADGFDLATYRWEPEGEPRALLQIVHGMAEHAARYEHVARAFTAAGFLVHAHDHRGHGGSIPEGDAPGHLGDEGGWGKLIGDAHARADALHAEHPTLPRAILAHSMGGYVAQGLLSEHPDDADAWALSGSGGKPPAIAGAGRLLARAERLRLGKRGVSALVRKLTFEDFNASFEGRTDFDWLSRDATEVDRYVADPLCGFDVTIETWVQLLDAMAGLTRSDRLARIPREKPIYVFGGGSDTSVQRGAGLRRLAEAYRRAGSRDVTLQIWPDARHEVLNETHRAEVIAHLLAWVRSKLGLAESRPVA